MSGIRKFIVHSALVAFCSAAFLSAQASEIKPQQHAIITLPSGDQYFLRTETNKNSLPKLFVKKLKQHKEEETTIFFGEDDPELFSNKAPTFLYFKSYSVAGLPNPLIVAIAAAPGGSDTQFVMKIMSFNNHQIKVLNYHGWKTLIEGGVSLGLLPNQKTYGAIVWNFLLSPNEAHTDRHRYKVDIYQWNGINFDHSKTLLTKNKYNTAEEGLKELHIKAHDLINADFKVFDNYR